MIRISTAKVNPASIQNMEEKVKELDSLRGFSLNIFKSNK